jgi:hypothetical protein
MKQFLIVTNVPTINANDFSLEFAGPRVLTKEAHYVSIVGTGDLRGSDEQGAAIWAIASGNWSYFEELKL